MVERIRGRLTYANVAATVERAAAGGFEQDVLADGQSLESSARSVTAQAVSKD